MKKLLFKRLFACEETANRRDNFSLSRGVDKTKKNVPKPRVLRAEALEDRALLSATTADALLAPTTFVDGEPQLWETSTFATSPISFELEPEARESNEVEQGALAYMIDESLLDLGVDPNSLTEEFVFNLSSNPTSTYTIYLDFDGHITTGTLWNRSYGNVETPPYDRDGNVSSFSQAELHDIYEIWLRVSEDYAPFDVNVTTVEPTSDQLIKSSASDNEYGVRCCVGGSWEDWYESAGGVSYLGSFTWDSDTPCYSFSKSLGSASNAAAAASHEVGHSLGLRHDGIYELNGSETEYYDGANDWGPIMGSGYYVELTQWSKGEYERATNQEDDLSIIASNGFGYKEDDHRDLRVQATSFELASDGTLASGVIETNDDIDFFSFVNTGATDYLYIGGVSGGVTNLDVVVALYDADGNLIKTYDPSNSLYVVVELADLTPGATYYFSVSGTGLTVGGTQYYSDYASLGNYLIVARQDDEQLDRFEPNNAFTKAYDLGFVNSNVSYDSLLIGSTVDSDDYYKFEIGATGTASNFIRTEYDKETDSNRTMYLGLYDSEQNRLKYCYYSNTDWQEVSLEGLVAGTYFIRIYNQSTLSKSYDYKLIIDAPSVQVPTRSLTSLKIANEPKVGSTLLAVLEYSDATANYQWSYADSADSTSWTPIQGANDASFTPSRFYVGKYLKVVAEGAGKYVGTVEAVTGSPVALTKTVDLVELNSVAISGTLSVGQTVTTSLTPDGATANYQWYRSTSNTPQANWTKLEGAINDVYSPVSADFGYFLKVVATGVGDFTGEVYAVSSARVAKNSESLTSVSLSGQFKTGETISAVLQPTGATASYQWYRATSNDESASWILISGAASASYVPNASDVGYYLKVVATGTEYYSGEVSAVSASKVAANFISLSSISISGTLKVGETLTTTLRPLGATASYQWYRASSSSADEWTPISGADGASYKLTEDDLGKYVKVVATGTGNYTGEAYVVSTGEVETNLVTLSSISISGTLKVGETASTTLRPSGATANYQWYRANSSYATEWTPISGADQATYKITDADAGFYLKVVATGTGEYVGEVSAVSTSEVESNLISLSSLSISGSFKVGETLSTTLRPLGATANYQWFRANSSSASEWTPINGANMSTYKPTTADLGAYLKVVATGTGNYVGEVVKVGTTRVVMNLTSVAMSGDLKVGETLTATVKPTDATVKYQWYYATSSSASAWTAISGANKSTYTLADADLGRYLKVVATGTGEYVGEVSAVSTAAVVPNYISLASISISGSFNVGQTLTTTLRPSGATANYQWYRAESKTSAEWTAITGATKSTYTTTDGDVGYYLKVVAIGTGKYEGTVSQIASKPLDGFVAPTDLIVDDFNPTAKTVDLKWTDNSSLDKGFRIEVSTDGGKTWKLSALAGSDATTKTCSVSLKDTTYQFRVAEYSGSSISDWSNTIQVQTVPYAPNAVKFAFNAGSCDSGVLTWKDASKTENGFVVERSVNDGEWEVVGETKADVSTFEIKALTTETTYSFRVVAKNDFSSAVSKTTNITTTPTAPGDLLVTQGATNSSFVLNWTDNSNLEKGFRIEYSTDSGKTWKLKTTVKANETSKTVSLSSKDVNSLFRVAAYNDAGYSQWTTGSLTQTAKSALPQVQNDARLSEALQLDDEDAFWFELENSLK